MRTKVNIAQGTRPIVIFVVEYCSMSIKDVPTYPKFRYIKLSDKDVIDDYLRLQPLFSEAIFSNLYIWRLNGLKTKISKIENNLILKTCDVARGGYNTILLSKNYKQIDRILASYFFDKNIDKPNNYSVMLPELAIKFIKEDFLITEDLVNDEYVYRVEDLATLKGNKYSVARANVNKFARTYPSHQVLNVDYFNLNSKSKLLVRELFERWNKYKNGTHTAVGFYEYEAINLLFLHAEYFGLRLILIKDGDHIVAFATVEISKDLSTAYVCFAKTDVQYKGASETLIHNVAKFLLTKKVKFINFEQDLGIEKLRNYKLKLRPYEINKIYIVKPNR